MVQDENVALEFASSTPDNEQLLNATRGDDCTTFVVAESQGPNAVIDTWCRCTAPAQFWIKNVESPLEVEPRSTPFGARAMLSSRRESAAGRLTMVILEPGPTNPPLPTVTPPSGATMSTPIDTLKLGSFRDAPPSGPRRHPLRPPPPS